jgi:dihydrofolate reductase
VMQAPGGAQEDTAGGFEYGGWQISFPSDQMMDSKLSEIMNAPFELLLGKTTYNIFASYWPTATTDLDVAAPFNKTKKYVVSHEAFEPSWNNSTCITGDVVTQLKKLKEEDGPDLWVWGSGNLIQTLLKDHLIDQMNLWIYPITIGKGKRLFADGTQPENFKLVEAKISETGVLVATYEPSAPLKTS